MIELNKKKEYHFSQKKTLSGHDLTIARYSSLKHLENGEKCVADLGYIVQVDKIITPLPNTSTKNGIQNKIMGHLRQNVERINNRVKNFNCCSEWRVEEKTILLFSMLVAISQIWNWK